MNERTQREVTGLLLAWSEGDQDALGTLLPRVYDELRRLASIYLRRERSGHTLDTGALVNEAYLRLVDQDRVAWQNRAQFFGVAAQMMRRVLVDHARRHLYAKRGGGAPRFSLDEALTLAPERAPELVALDEALEELEKLAPRNARIVELRFFGGLSGEEIAEVLDVSVPTITRGWRMARAWLYRRLGGNGAHGE
jgi:RNA polymerase sigma factor (TIGR02999 family)